MKATEEEISEMKEHARKVCERTSTLFYAVPRYRGENSVTTLIYAVRYNPKKDECYCALAMMFDENKCYFSKNADYMYYYGYRYDFNVISRETDSEELKDGFHEASGWKTNPSCKLVGNWHSVLEKANPGTRFIPDVAEIIERRFTHKLNAGVNIIMKYPHQVELLHKMNHDEFITNTKVLRMNPKDFNRILEYAKNSKLEPTDTVMIQWNLKHGIKAKDALTRYEQMKVFRIMKALNSDDFREGVEIYRYLAKQAGRSGDFCPDYLIDDYTRYIEGRNELGLTSESHSARFPSNLENSYGNMIEVLEEKKKRDHAKMLMKLEDRNRKYLESLRNLEVKDKHYSVMNPETNEEFVKLGKIFDNCVGSMGYYEKQLEGNCAIFAVLKDGKYYACLEIGRLKNGKTAIKQLYRKSNQPCDKTTRQFVNREIVPQVNFGLVG